MNDPKTLPMTFNLHYCDSNIDEGQFLPISNDTTNDFRMHSTPKDKGASYSTIEIQTSPALFSDESNRMLPIRSVEKSFSRSLSSPLIKTEEGLHTHLTKRKLNFTENKSVIKCKQGVNPLY